jgi:hypothetical protein
VLVVTTAETEPMSNHISERHQTVLDLTITAIQAITIQIEAVAMAVVATVRAAGATQAVALVQTSATNYLDS